MVDVKVSVVIPVFNVAPYLRQCIDSIVGQTLREIEVLCIDDGSTDESPTLLDEYANKDSRIKVYHCEHSDAGTARNYGMDRAIGKYITFIDSDDFCDLDMLECMYSAAEEKFADVVVCRARSFSEKTKKIAEMRGSIKDNLLPQTADGCFSYKDCPDRIFQLFVAWTWDKLYRFSVLKDNNIRGQALPAANSFTLSCEVLVKAKRIFLLDRVLYTQRQDLDSSITHRLEEAWDCCYKASKRLLDDLLEWGMYEELMISYQNIALHNCCWYLQKLKNDRHVYGKLYSFLHNGALVDLRLVDLHAGSIFSTKEYAVYETLRNYSYTDFLSHEIDTLRKLTGSQRAEINAIRSSVSFKIGRCLTHIPRKIRDIRRKIRDINSIKAFGKQAIQTGKESNLKRSDGVQSICIVAFEYFHYFILENIIRIANYDKNYVEVYTHSKAMDQLAFSLGDDYKKINWHIMPKPYGISNEEKLKKIDAWKHEACKAIVHKRGLNRIFLVSPEYKSHEYDLIFSKHCRNTEVIAMVHNLNGVFRAQVERAEVYKTLCKASSYAVLTETLKAEIEKSHLTEKPVYIFPIVYRPNQITDPGQNDRVHFIIAGNVESNRKDYDLVLEVFADMEEYYKKMNLTILGRADSSYAKSVIAKCEVMKQQGLDVLWYTNYVDEKEFEDKMEKAACLLGPVRIVCNTNGVDEIYGVTKATGVLTDMVKYAKPAIVPHNLKMPSNMMSSTLFYENAEEFRKHIIDLLDPKNLEMLTQEALRNSQAYAIENFCL